jgi:cytochrome c6
MNLKKNYFFFILLLFLFNLEKACAINLEKGEKIFQVNCSVCHENGNNIIIAEKNLKKENLETNGMNSISSISYQVTNGKNGMPAFGGRLTENDIENVANYIIYQAERNFQK